MLLSTDLLRKIASFHESLAADVYPRGGTLTCPKCGRSEEFDCRQAANYLHHGWPRCCGYTTRSEIKEDPNA